MHNIFSSFLCFTSYFAHLGAVSNNFNGNDEELQITQTRHPKIVADRQTDGVDPLLDLLSLKRRR